MNPFFQITWDASFPEPVVANEGLVPDPETLTSKSPVGDWLPDGYWVGEHSRK